MFRRALALSLVVLASGTTAAAANPWTDRPGRPAGTPQLRPDHKRLLRLDVAQVRTALGRGRVAVPRPEGGFTTFVVTPAPVLAPKDARRHPELRTFTGTAVGDPATTAALDLTPQGFHATVRGPGGSWSVDPYTDSAYAAYPAGALPRGRGFEEEGMAPPSPLAPDGQARAGAAAVALRTFRLALVSDRSYAATTAAAPTDDTVLAAKATLVNRVDFVYGQDLGIRLVLDASPELSLNTQDEETAAGFSQAALAKCGSGSANPTLDQSTDVIDGLIGSAAYDVGHVVLAKGRGGLADVAVVGDADDKGRGCTALTTPVGDQFAIDYLAHELGHQFGGQHTFNGTLANCGGNRVGSSAVEPGSGSSIMAYAGICGADDLQANSDPYFSQRSIGQIRDFAASIPAVGTTTPTADASPVVEAPADATIPPRTPFRLTATGSDPDGDEVTYSWEENDTGASAALLAPAAATGPLFRVFSAAATELGGQSPAPGQNLVTTDPTRTFPDLEQIVAGRTNAATDCATGDGVCASEKLPTVGRRLSFRVTARDGRGGIAQDDVGLTVAGDTPLTVTSQPEDAVAAGASVATVTWTPVGLGPLRARFVTVEGRLIDLAINLPDSGSADVRLPPGRTGRIEVGAMAGTFFDLSPGVVTTDGTAEEPPPPPADGSVVAAPRGRGTRPDARPGPRAGDGRPAPLRRAAVPAPRPRHQRRATPGRHAPRGPRADAPGDRPGGTPDRAADGRARPLEGAHQDGRTRNARQGRRGFDRAPGPSHLAAAQGLAAGRTRPAPRPARDHPPRRLRRAEDGASPARGGQGRLLAAPHRRRRRRGLRRPQR